MTQQNPRRSTLKVLGLPDSFGQTILVLSLIFALAPYIPGADFGIFKIPFGNVDPFIIRLLRYLGPALFGFAILLHLPVWSPEGKRQAHAAELDRVLGDLRRASGKALVDLTSPTYNAASMEAILGADVEDLVDQWSRLEQTPEAEPIRKQYRELATRFAREGNLTASFRDDAKVVISGWHSYFDSRRPV